MAVIQSHLPGPISFVISTTSTVIASTEALDPSKSTMRVGINFSPTPGGADILTSSCESQMLLMASGMVNPFQKVSNLLCPDPLGNYYLQQL